ncbi:hypothetical protein EVA_18629 [gut metagenome]|uniref:Uncharacterized protein n=1 Tax=gut metagenome TaxID=749906 RepID=J9FFP8_9ZZZZ
MGLQRRDRRCLRLRRGRGGVVMTRREEIDLEIRQQALRLYPKCTALFELPYMIYAQILKDNELRKKPYRVSEDRIRKVIHTMAEFQ